MFPPGIEPGTSRVLSGSDDHYTTETAILNCKTIVFVNMCKTYCITKEMSPLGIEPETFRVLGGCDDHYTTETVVLHCKTILFVNM